MIHSRKLSIPLAVSVSMLACRHAPEAGGTDDVGRHEPVRVATPIPSKPTAPVIVFDDAPPEVVVDDDFCTNASPAVPGWVCAVAGAAFQNEPMLFGTGSSHEEKTAQIRAVHSLDSAWRSFVRLLDLELHGRDISQSGRLPLPEWAGNGSPRMGVSIPQRWVGHGEVHLQASVSLTTVLAPLGKVANKPDFEKAAREVHNRLVARDIANETESIAGEKLAVVQFAMGLSHACAVLDDRTVACWGTGELGQLGVRVNESHATIPRRVPRLKDVKSVAIGGRTTCAVTNQGDVVCWGVGRHGQLGNAELEKGSDPWETPYSASPVPIKGLSDISEVTVSDEHVCALHRKGYVSCWGSGSHGVLGRPATEEKTILAVNGPMRQIIPVRVESQPQRVPKLERVRHIVAGQSLTCAVMVDGRVLCWGQVPGPFGGAIQEDACGPGCVFAPTEIVGIRSAQTMSVGAGFACALLADGTVSCWGAGNRGQLGSAHCERGCSPMPVPNVRDVTSIAAGPYSVCAVSKQGSIWCWGRGDIFGYASATRSPTMMHAPKDVVDIGVGFTACARTTSGGLSCWGRNGGGEIGDGTILPMRTPYQVRELGKSLSR